MAQIHLGFNPEWLALATSTVCDPSMLRVWDLAKAFSIGHTPAWCVLQLFLPSIPFSLLTAVLYPKPPKFGAQTFEFSLGARDISK
ncbi:hypothetical protein B0H10DRAFT_2049474 [Mycena sp. CBHHK59/15]|nr:hypothetical protein B0H10DRAFT_2049474 [Mycena sp. CBHHK59/15]